ncbi:hypothetical protein HPB49_015985 [Dermacentor silvarum]|uniref:Uncharacterized protein n=1 Tax=Dermacentor silvarum TaxID=543639 RepID=A0ACB8C4H1_DERSI|nr:hypothetical protein HPB49_015985 [Dermacentor silvarum]
MNIGELLDLRRQRNQVYFQKIQAEMANLGFHWTWQQLRTHWKNLKGRYNKERVEQNRSGAAPSSWLWYAEMSAILSHRPMTEAQAYGIDSQVDTEVDDSRTASGSNTPVPRAKRPRRTRNAELAEILAEQQNRTAETLKKHTELIFEQQRQLLEDEQKKFGEIISTISTSFLQGTQAMLAQLLSQPVQAYPQPLQIYSQALQPDSQQSRLFQFTQPIFTTAEPVTQSTVPPNRVTGTSSNIKE